MALRSEKPHWTPGKIWVFYWDEAKRWVMFRPRNCNLYFDSFIEVQATLANPIMMAFRDLIAKSEGKETVQ